MRCALVVLLLTGSCIDSGLVECGDLTCPVDAVCVSGACFPKDRVAACTGLVDGTPCTTSELPDGTCTNGVCVGPICGDGIVEGTEQCDGSVSTMSCLDHGFYEPSGLACTADCRIDTTGCSGGYCGDHIIDGPELCDGAPPAGVSCLSIGFDRGVIGCSSICGVDTTPCGLIDWHSEPTVGATSTGLADMIEVQGVDLGLATNAVFRRASGTWTADMLPTIPSTTHLNGIYGQTLDDIWIVGDGGTMLHDDATEWTQVTAVTSAKLTAVRGSSATNVFAVGAAGTALHYDGSTWQAMTTGVTADLARLAVVSASDVYAVGKLGTIIHWDGLSWTAMTSGTTASLLAVVALDAHTVYAAGNGGVLLRYDGLSWQPIATPSAAAVTELLPTTDGIIMVAVTAVGVPPQIVSILMRYDGTHLAVLDAGTTLYTAGMTTAAGEHLIGTNVGSLVVWKNSGPMWEHSLPDPLFDAVDVSAIAVDDVYAVGTYATGTAAQTNQVIHFDGTSWTVVLDLGAEAVSAVVARASGDVYVGGAGFHHWDGMSWTTVTAPVTIENMSAAPGTALYAVGSGGIASYDGASWTGPIIPGDFHRVHVFPDGEVLALGAGKVGSVPTNVTFDGTNWTETTVTAQIVAANAIWGATAGAAFLVGNPGMLQHYDGTSWSRVELGIPENLTGIAGTATDDIWITTSFGEIDHFDGMTWSPVRARFDPAGAPIFTRVDATSSMIVLGGLAGRVDLLWR